MAFFKAVLQVLGGILMLAGMIIGAGMFAIPFLFLQAGFLLGAIELVFLAACVVILHLSYADIVIRTDELHRLPGYANIYLGPWARIISLGSMVASSVGTLLVYLLLGSRFLHEALRIGNVPSFVPEQGSDLLLVLILAGIGAFITYFPIRGEALVNGVLTAILLLFISFLFYLLYPMVNLVNARGLAVENAALPYGVLLFALWGGIVIPDIATFLGKNPLRTRIAVFVGTLIPAIVYFLFSFVIIGVSGARTSQEALSGLFGIVPDKTLLIGIVIGLLAVFTSFIAVGKTLQLMLELDLGVPRVVSWLAGSSVPVFLYFLGFTDFIVIIAIIGATAIGIDAALILLVFYRMKREHNERIPWYGFAARVVIFCIVLGGIGYHLFWGSP